MTEPVGRVERIPGSFRDPSGFVYERDGRLLRQVNRSFAEDYDSLLSSGCYDALVGEGLLVPHEEVDLDLAATSDAYRVLAPRRVPFVSFPYEWCPAQRRDAALLTLRAQDVALDHGMTLRDASAFNVQLERGRPILIDTLSTGRYVEGEPWVAYRQFCQHFLAPLALEALVDVRLAGLLQVHLDGIPLDLASRLLPGRTSLRPGLALHVHAQARASRARAAAPAAERRAVPRLSERAMRGLVDGLRGAIGHLHWEPGRTTWSDYYEEADHYGAEAMAAKEEAVGRFLRRVAPARVWDLGANTGRFSALAAEGGASVVAFDVDPGAVQRAWHEVVERPVDVLPLVLDLTAPSPGVGWAHAERPALAERGPCDLVLALALVHHLAIAGNVPLDRIAAYASTLGEHLIVEWVPKSDTKVQVLLATREDVFADYTEDGFAAAFAERFTTVERQPVAGTERVLHLLQRR